MQTKITILIIFALLPLGIFAQNQWQEIGQLPFIENSLTRNFYFIDENVGFIEQTIPGPYMGDLTYIVFKTTDGGASWNSINLPDSSNVIRDIDHIRFLDENIGYCCVYDRIFPGGGPPTFEYKLYKTTDGGNIWYITNNNHSFFDDYSIINSNTLLGISSSSISFSNNSGLSWNNVNMQNDGFVFTNYGINSVNKIQFINNTDAFIVGIKIDSIAIFKTIDGGINWNMQSKFIIPDPFPTGTPPYEISLHFVNSSVGFISAHATATNTGVGSFIRTTDGGINCTATNWQLNDSNSLAGQILFVNQDVGWLVNTGDAGGSIPTKGFYRTTDGGNNFGITYPYWGLICSTNNNNQLLAWGVTYENGVNKVIKWEALPFKNISFYQNVTPPATNPNNIIVPGKNVRFRTEIQNNFGKNLLTLSGVISTTNPHVTIVQNTGAFNNIVDGSSGWNANDFEIYLSPDIPNNEVIEFEMLLNDQIVQGGPWLVKFSFPVVLNPFDMSNNIIDDDNIPDSQGNDNNIAEPNETIEIIPLMDNLTPYTFTDIEGYLFSPYPEINIWNNTQGITGTVFNHYSYGTLSPNATNVSPVSDFVFENNFNTIYNLPFTMIMTGKIGLFNGSDEYKNIEFRWGADFVMNDGYPNNPNQIINSNIEPNVIIYPNPINKFINIEVGSKHQTINYQLINSNGQKVYEGKFIEKTLISMIHLTPGLYLLKLNIDNSQVIKKIIKE